MESRSHRRRISVSSKYGWRIVIFRMRGLFANWKELQHTGVCLRNIHRNTNCSLTPSRFSLTPSLRPLRGFAISFARASPLNSDGCGVVWCGVMWCGGVNNNATLQPYYFLFDTSAIMTNPHQYMYVALL